MYSMYNMSPFPSFFLLAAALVPHTLAQAWTSCNPLNTTDCPVDKALGVSNYSIDFTQSTMSTSVWNTTAGVINYGDNGAQFTVAKRLDSPTVQSIFYIFFGQVEVIMKAASGQGIISSIVLQSDDLDEVDWELMGGNNTHVETNYYGKGNISSAVSTYYPIENPQETWHNYTLDWSPEKIDWIVDDNIIRTLKYEEAAGGLYYPQTPTTVRLGIWPGGDPKNPNGTIEWAGGLVDYDKGPYTMDIKSLRVSDATTGTQYKYGDTSGSWQSIQVSNTTKPIGLDGNNSQSSSQTMKQKWNSMSETAKIAIFASVGSVLALALGLLTFCCIKQRRIGRRERALEDAKFEKDAAELLSFRGEMARQQALKTEKTQESGLGGPRPYRMM